MLNVGMYLEKGCVVYKVTYSTITITMSVLLSNRSSLSTLVFKDVQCEALIYFYGNIKPTLLKYKKVLIFTKKIRIRSSFLKQILVIRATSMPMHLK